MAASDVSGEAVEAATYVHHFHPCRGILCAPGSPLLLGSAVMAADIERATRAQVLAEVNAALRDQAESLRNFNGYASFEMAEALEHFRDTLGAGGD